MVRIGISTFVRLPLIIGFITSVGLACPPKVNHSAANLPADQVEGSYQWKTFTIHPAYDFGTGPITDLLTWMSTNSPCVHEEIITFQSGGTVSITQPAGCEKTQSMGVTETSKWVRSQDTLLVTELDGTQTSFALSLSGNVMRLTSKAPMPDGHNGQKMHQMTIELTRR